MKRSSLTAIFFTVFIDLLGFGILIPLLPTFASKQLNISDLGIGILVAVFSLVQFFFNPVLGKISDKRGRRPLILSTLLMTCFSYIIFSFSDSFMLLFISRLLAGFGGSNIGVAQAYIADITTKQERSKGMGIIGAAFGLGFVFGPLIGGILSKYGYMVAGLAAAGFSFAAFIYSYFFLKESIAEKQSPETRIQFRLLDLEYVKKVIKTPNVGLLIIIFFIVTFSIANIYGTFAILGLKVYHFTDQQTGYLFGIMGIVGALMQGGIIRRLAQWFNDKTLISIGTFLMIFGLGLIPYGGNFLGLSLVMVIQALGTGILQPTILSMVSKYSSDKEQGGILGLNQSISALARVLGPLWGGFSYDFLGYQFPFLTGGFFMLLTFLFSIYILKSDRHFEIASK